MDLKQKVLNKLAEEVGQDNWDCLKKSLTVTGDFFAVKYSERAVELAIKETQKEIDKMIVELENPNKEDLSMFQKQVFNKVSIPTAKTTLIEVKKRLGSKKGVGQK